MNAAAAQRVRVELDGGVAWVTLDRPEKRNALDLAMYQGIAAAQRRLEREASLRVVILQGAGEDFCSGLDVKAMMGDRRAMLRLLWKWLPWRPNLAQQAGVGWRRLRAPVIAVIQGRCWGGGLQIALGADFRLLAPSASLSLMEAKWGLIPDMGGTLALRELLACDRAMRLAMTADTVTAEEALTLGLATAVDADPAGSARQLAARLANRSPDALAAIKRLYHRSWCGGEGATLARETLHQWGVLLRPNQRIAVRRERGEQISYRDRR